MYYLEEVEMAGERTERGRRPPEDERSSSETHLMMHFTQFYVFMAQAEHIAVLQTSLMTGSSSILPAVAATVSIGIDELPT